MSLQQWANDGWLKAHQTLEFTRTDVRAWLQENHIELLLPEDQK
jgi:hypothetical protein